MKTNLTALERKILGAVQYGLPMSRRPYQDISQSIGITVEQLLGVLKQWKMKGKIRRAGAIVNHFQMGRGIGAMVAWDVPEDKIDQIGQIFAAVSKVSHAYLRPYQEQWPYNFYTMVHASDTGELEATIQAMSRQSGITAFQVLKTVQELKKVPPTYIVGQ